MPRLADQYKIFNFAFLVIVLAIFLHLSFESKYFPKRLLYKPKSKVTSSKWHQQSTKASHSLQTGICFLKAQQYVAVCCQVTSTTTVNTGNWVTLWLIKRKTTEKGLVCDVALCRFEDTVKAGKIPRRLQHGNAPVLVYGGHSTLPIKSVFGFASIHAFARIKYIVPCHPGILA